MPQSQELVEIRHVHRFDESALARYLESKLHCAGPLSAMQFEGGQSNPTFLVSCGDKRLVLRKKPPGSLLPTAHMVDREFVVLRALGPTAVPVPKAVHLCQDESIIGTPFYLMEYLHGRIFWDPTLPEVAATERRAIYREMARTLATLHAVDYEAVGLSDFGKQGNYFARQIRRWTGQYEAAQTEDNEAMQHLIDWLPKNAPPDNTTTIVHGDFRLDNLIYEESSASLRAVIDWELSTLGHPLADLAYNCLPYHFSRRSEETLSSAAGRESGIPTEQEYLDWYLELTGRQQIANWTFYLAFSLFRLASISQGVYKRALQGNASSTQGHRHIDTARRTSKAGWAVVEGRH